jgi:hypothetical protein
MGAPQYSPFMMYPLGPPIQGYRSAEGAAGSPMNVPGSPMSPGMYVSHLAHSMLSVAHGAIESSRVDELCQGI